jgi:hypothetical protein
LKSCARPMTSHRHASHSRPRPFGAAEISQKEGISQSASQPLNSNAAYITANVLSARSMHLNSLLLVALLLVASGLFWWWAFGGGLRGRLVRADLRRRDRPGSRALPGPSRGQGHQGRTRRASAPQRHGQQRVLKPARRFRDASSLPAPRTSCCFARPCSGQAHWPIRLPLRRPGTSRSR